MTSRWTTLTREMGAAIHDRDIQAHRVDRAESRLRQEEAELADLQADVLRARAAFLAEFPELEQVR